MPYKNWNHFGDKPNFHNQNKGNFNKDQDFKRGNQFNKFGGQFPQNNQNNRGNAQRHFNRKDRHFDRKGDFDGKVFNMGGIKGEIIGSDRQRINLNKRGEASLSNRISLGTMKFIFNKNKMRI